MQKAKYVSELKRYVKSSSGNGSRDVAVFQNDTSHTASTKTSHHIWYQTPTECQHPHVVRHAKNQFSNSPVRNLMLQNLNLDY